MTIYERINIFERLFDELTNESSRLGKERLLGEFRNDYPELQQDLTIILETLDNRHPIGWTFIPNKGMIDPDFHSIGEMILWLKGRSDTSEQTIRAMQNIIGDAGQFIAPIVNRTLRLGIGKSQLVKDKLSPILAKKYEGTTLHTDVYVTEKLDGNRCLAYHDGEQWQYRSRNGKTLNVQFDMTGMPEEFIYDGEIMSKDQTYRSIERAQIIKHGDLKGNWRGIEYEQLEFNKTSGLINRKSNAPKDLVYNIFDIVSDQLYHQRREILSYLATDTGISSDIRFVPILYTGTDNMHIATLLDRIVAMGGEGVMLNVHNRRYEHKRSDALLKYKQVQTMDMLVIGTFEGKGKYQHLCGGLKCYARLDDGREVRCEVGSGLSDQQREDWAFEDINDENNKIVGKIIEVAYHEMTQDRHNIGSKLFSLRFPRLKRVRLDKTLTSQF